MVTKAGLYIVVALAQMIALHLRVLVVLNKKSATDLSICKECLVGCYLINPNVF